MSEKEQVVSGFRDYPLTIDKILAWVSYAFPNNEIVYWPPGGSRILLLLRSLPIGFVELLRP